MSETYKTICERIEIKKREYNTKSESFGIMTDIGLGTNNGYEINAIHSLIPLIELQAVIKELELLKQICEATENFKS